MKNPKVSICCPSYNSGKFIFQTISSFTRQSLQDIEILISDDCSSDDTYSIIKNNFNDERIKLFKQEKNIGVSLNLNFLINESQSEYIALCGNDDVMNVDRLEKSYKFMKNNPDCDMVYTFVDIINANGLKIKHKMDSLFNQNMQSIEMLRYFFYNGNFLNAPSVIIKTSILKKLQFNPCLLQLQDFDMWIRILLNNFNIKCLPEKLTQYRIHGDNLSISTNKNKKKELNSRDCFEHSKVLLNFIKHIKNTDDFEKVFNKKVFNKKLIPFAISYESLALKHSKAHLTFAINTIYNELLDNDKRHLIAETYNFHMKDFYKLCSNFLQQKEKKSIFTKLKNSIIKRLKIL